MDRRARLMEMYQAMLEAGGPRGWWPAKSPFEVMVGAMLTQNTAWKGVAKAIADIEARGLLSPRALADLPEEELAELVRPTGHFRVKARRLGNLLAYLERACGYDLSALEGRDTDALRAELLEVKGVGPETADSILLYALGRPVFVVDAYTRRVFSRHGLVPEDVDYDGLRDYFQDVLEPDVRLYNDFHAQIVGVGHHFCKTQIPLCDRCPLRPWL